MNLKALLLVLLTTPTLFAEDEVKINAMNANAALRSVIFTYAYKSFCAKAVNIDSKAVIPVSLDFLKSRSVPVVWGNPDNKSDSQLLKAFLGTRLSCSSVTKDSDDKTRISVQSECVVSRREVIDKSKDLTFQNTTDKVMWDVPTGSVLVSEKEVLGQIQSQLNGLFEQFIAKNKKDEFKTTLAESYYKLIK